MLIGDAVDLLHSWYPPAIAESWDRVGLAVGDRSDPVTKVLLAVDPTLAVVDEAIGSGCDLLITHHPLLLKGVHSVEAGTPKGRAVHRLIRGGCALLCAHTNADQPVDGVSDSVARALGLNAILPLIPDDEPLDKLTTFVPATHADQVRTALAQAGAGGLGDYDSCSFSTLGEGRFRPLTGANPTIGEVGALEVVDEVRIEAVLSPALRQHVLRALLESHPYEVPAYDVVALRPSASSDCGTGRVGELAEPESLAAFAERVRDALPETAQGVRVSGDPDRVVRRVALVGGAGDGFFDAASRSGADVYLTSDLRHHPASEFREQAGAPALVDVAHWAAEWTWLPVLAERLRGVWGDTVSVQVSTLCTDPWNFRV